MKATVNREALCAAVGLLTGAGPAANQQQILKSVLLIADATNNLLTTVATNLNMRMSSTIPATVSASGTFAVPASLLQAMLREVPSPTIHLAPTPGSKLKLTAGSVVFHVPTIDASEFPKPFAAAPTVNLNVDQREFVTMLRRVAFAQSTNTSRFALCGTHIIVEARSGGRAHITAIASDQHILSKAACQAELDCELPKDRSTFRFIIDRHTVNEIVRAADRLVPEHRSRLSFDERHMSLTLLANGPAENTRRIEISALLTNATYPDTSRILSQIGQFSAQFEASVLRETLERIIVVCDDSRDVPMTITFNADSATFHADSRDYGSAKDVLSYADGSSIPPGRKIWINPQTLLGMVKPFAGETLRLYTSTANPDVIHLGIDDIPDYRGIIAALAQAKEQPAAA